MRRGFLFEGLAPVDQPANVLESAIRILVGVSVQFQGQGPFDILDAPAEARVEVRRLVKQALGGRAVPSIVLDGGDPIPVCRAAFSRCGEVHLVTAVGFDRSDYRAKVL